MKALIVALGMAVASVGLWPETAEARRFGGGGSSGMQRSMPAKPAPDAAPAKPAQAAPAATNAATAGAAPKRNWLGPIAGLAAGLGLAALLSHFGLGEGFASLLMMVLLAVAAFFVIRMLMRRFAGAPQRPLTTPQGVPLGQAPFGGHAPAADAPMARNTLSGTPATPAPSALGNAWGPGAVAAPFSAAASFANAPVLPAGFGQAAFERVAKMIFVRMQAANDAADLNDLRQFTTPEMFASVRVDLQERGAATQRTDVERVDAEIVDFVDEPERQIVSVRFHGLIKEDPAQAAASFDEVWHLVRPTDGSREWAIAGIQQSANA